MHELRAARFFDVFEFNAPAQQRNCFLCNHLERAPGFMQEDHSLVEGQLKKKTEQVAHLPALSDAVLDPFGHAFLN